MVAPFLLNEDHPLYSVSGVFNAIFLHGNVLGDVMFYGSGAGKLPTASAVVSDVIDAAKHQNRNIMVSWSSQKLELGDIAESRSKFFVRISGNADTDLGKIKEVFGDVKLVQVPEYKDEFGFVTGLMSEADYEEKAAKVPGILKRIRVEERI